MESDLCGLSKTIINTEIDTTTKTDPTQKDIVPEEKKADIIPEESLKNQKEEELSGAVEEIQNIPSIQNEETLVKQKEHITGDQVKLQIDKCEEPNTQAPQSSPVKTDIESNNRKQMTTTVPTITIDEAPNIKLDEDDEGTTKDEHNQSKDTQKEPPTPGSESTESESPLDELKDFIQNILPQQGPGSKEAKSPDDTLTDQQLGLAKLLDGTPLSRRGSFVDAHADDDSDEREGGHANASSAGNSTEKNGNKDEYKDANTEKYTQNLETDCTLVADRARLAERIIEATKKAESSGGKKDSGDDDGKRSNNDVYSSPKKKKKEKKKPYVYIIFGMEVYCHF